MSISDQSISPLKVVRGEGAWNRSLELITKLSKRPLIIGRSSSTKKIRTSFKNDLISKGIQTLSLNLAHDCCEFTKHTE